MEGRAEKGDSRPSCDLDSALGKLCDLGQNPLPLLGLNFRQFLRPPSAQRGVFFSFSQEKAVGLADLLLLQRKLSLGSSFFHSFIHAFIHSVFLRAGHILM